MIDLIIARQTINSDALDAELRSALAEKVLGISSNGANVTVHLDDTATEADLLQAESLVIAHDPAQLTPRQQRIETRRDQLDTDRDANTVPLNLDDYLLQLPLIRRLAQKIAWLEREIRDLRDL
ncbi:MAG: hypothetical protein RLP44_28040 [Aggregatilineales bacterium]